MFSPDCPCFSVVFYVFPRFSLFSSVFPWFLRFCNVFPWISLFASVFLRFSFCLFSRVFLRFSLFSHVFLCFSLILPVFACLSMFYYDSSCVLVFFSVFPCFPVFSYVFRVFLCFSLFSNVFLCFPLILSSFLVPKKVCKSFTSRCVFVMWLVFLFCNKIVNWTDVHKPFRHLENKKAACQFSRQGWRGLPYDHFSLVKNIVRPIRRRERWFFTSEISSFVWLICATKNRTIFSSLSSVWINLSTYKINCFTGCIF